LLLLIEYVDFHGRTDGPGGASVLTTAQFGQKQSSSHLVFLFLTVGTCSVPHSICLNLLGGDGVRKGMG